MLISTGHKRIKTHIDGAVSETEALLDEVGELADAATVLSKHGSCARRVDDDLGAGRGGADLNSGVSGMSPSQNKAANAIAV